MHKQTIVTIIVTGLGVFAGQWLYAQFLKQQATS